MTTTKPDDKGITFLSEDYKQKVAYLTAHLTRMWTRFNIFVSIELALIGSKFLWQAKDLNAPAVMVVGAVTSLLWLLMGSEDRYLVHHYRQQVAAASKAWSEAIGLEQPPPHVGQVNEHKWLAYDGSVGVRLQGFSTTKLAAWVPLLVLVFWIVAWAVL